MTEADFWVSLEYRICREFQGMREDRLRRWWCDGFIPWQYDMDRPAPTISGKAWLCEGPDQCEWDFVLRLPRPAASPADVDWASLLPPEEMTRWLAVDWEQKKVTITPADAVPDRVTG